MTATQATLTPAAAALVARLWDASCHARTPIQAARLRRIVAAILAAAH